MLEVLHYLAAFLEPIEEVLCLDKILSPTLLLVSLALDAHINLSPHLSYHLQAGLHW